jgi:acyl-coenzyme A synthetase/AMP-(fatty) acid ligase
MSGYLDDPVATAEVLRDGWLLTGDLAHWDHKGRLVLDGREDELLKLRNGARFHPVELESTLAGLEGVDSAAVTIVGEQARLIALVVGKVDLAAIRKQLQESVAPHLVPDRILAVAELPVGNNGKLQRSQLAGLCSGEPGT